MINYYEISMTEDTCMVCCQDDISFHDGFFALGAIGAVINEDVESFLFRPIFDLLLPLFQQGEGCHCE